MRFLMIFCLGFIFYLGLSLVETLAQTPKSPQEVAQEDWNRLREGDIKGSVELFDPEALASFKEMMSFIEEVPEEELNDFLMGFFGEGMTKEKVLALDDRAFMSAIMENIFAMSGSSLSFDKIDFIGQIAEGKDTTHVLSRMYIQVEELQSESLEVLSLRKSPSGWGILLEGKMTGMAEKLKQVFDKKR